MEKQGRPHDGGRSSASPFVVAELGHANQAVVWPSMDGPVRGCAVAPIHASKLRCIGKPGAERLHQALVLLDLIRLGPDNDRSWATDLLSRLIWQPRA